MCGSNEVAESALAPASMKAIQMAFMLRHAKGSSSTAAGSLI